MPTIMDAKFAALRAQGFTGAMSDMTLQWLQDAGATSNHVADAWLEMLELQGLPISGQRNGLWYAYLGVLGYTGSINDRELQFWLAGGVLNPIPNLYVNPEFAGGVDDTTPPTAHTTVFNTLGYKFIDNGSGVFTVDINDVVATGRLLLQYNTKVNNPTLTVQNLYRISWDVRATASATFVLATQGITDTTIRTFQNEPALGTWATISAEFTPDTAAWTCNFRIGVGPTTNQTQRLEVRNPRLVDLGPVSNFSSGFNEGFF